MEYILAMQMKWKPTHRFILYRGSTKKLDFTRCFAVMHYHWQDVIQVKEHRCVCWQGGF